MIPDGYSQVIYEFKIDGMTCVNCSNAIEKGLSSSFADKGLVKDGISVILLMHKLKCIFYQEAASKSKVTPASIIEEVEDLGFGAELIAEHAV